MYDRRRPKVHTFIRIYMVEQFPTGVAWPAPSRVASGRSVPPATALSKGRPRVTRSSWTKKNRHVQQYVSLTPGVRRGARRPHALRNDGASPTDGVVEWPSVDGKGRANVLHGRTCEKERVGPFLGDNWAERPRVDT